MPTAEPNGSSAATAATNTTTTMSFTLGIEGDLPSGNHHWDASLTTGRSANVVIQLGSMRLHSYRDVLSFPNFGTNAIFDPNPWETSGFAETSPTWVKPCGVLPTGQPEGSISSA